MLMTGYSLLNIASIIIPTTRM